MPTTPQVAGQQFKLWARKLRSGEHAKLLEYDNNEAVGMNVQ